jgi:protein phosphatase 1 regulatory subunit 42
MSKTRQETVDHFLARITHLHLQGKRLRAIENLDTSTNLKVLFLYDNKIEEIANLEFAKGLLYLYLENNCIREMPQLANTKLKKLFVDENEINEIKGLELCTDLEVFSCARQRLPKLVPLMFSQDTLESICGTLLSLDISGNAISDLSPFKILYRLQKLIASDNNISDIGEIEGVVGLPDLEEVNFKRNPCCALRRYRDYVIGAASNSIRLFDDVAISQKNIDSVRGIQKLRRKIGIMDRTNSLSPSKYEESQEFEREESVHHGGGNQPSRDQYGGGDDQSLASSNGGQVVESEFTVAQY